MSDKGKDLVPLGKVTIINKSIHFTERREARDLYDFLNNCSSFVKGSPYKIRINGREVPWTTPLKKGDNITITEVESET